jgi:membrane protein implicated in regulation of membrane protease activity
MSAIELNKYYSVLPVVMARHMTVIVAVSLLILAMTGTLIAATLSAPIGLAVTSSAVIGLGLIFLVHMAAHRTLSATHEQKECRGKLAGREYPIALPIKRQNIKDIGVKIASGGWSAVYTDHPQHPTKVYKVIPLYWFLNGNEIRIARQAGELGVGPVVHDAYVLVTDSEEKFVVIEMEHAGSPLWEGDKWGLDGRSVIQSRYGEEGEQRFYLEFFKKIRLLAERHHVYYHDGHFGNILLHDQKGLLLIDFGQAGYTTDPQRAVKESLKDADIFRLFAWFRQVGEYAPESRDLLTWIDQSRS